MNPRNLQFEEHFHAARTLPAGEARDRYLAEALKDDPLLQKELADVLAAADAGEAAGIFQTRPREVAAEDPTIQMGEYAVPTNAISTGSLPGHDAPGTKIGPYKLLQEIGEGGFGVVWMAEQTEPVLRRVALKVIKPGMDTREVIARFEAERQAIAMMDHPNIARVFDVGATAAGRPYFAMELVKGMAITKFCDEQRLDTKRRLELFTEVCSAVNHAHQKGVIHRDIKPSNILLTLHGDRAVPKIIDFGIAKATQGRLTDKTLFTRFEQFVGTPVYMSPEQASLSGLDIDTRTDVYSLGVLLYELITGKPPFDIKSLLSAGFDEIRRIIREDEPPKPSTRLSTVQGEDRTTLTKTHHADPTRIGKLVKGDLDWIVMKAIEKDRTRRYETADAFGKDILRFLADEPVEAAAPSAIYRLRKFTRRNRRLVVVGAGAAAVLIGASAVSLWQAAKAREAERISAMARLTAESVLQETNETLFSAFRSSGKLQPLANVAETAVRYIAGLPLELRDLGTRRLAATAVENLAVVHFDRREVSAASKRWMEAIELRRTILAEAASDRQCMRDLAEALISHSEVLRKLGSYSAALDAVTEAERTLSHGLRIQDLPSPDLESLARSHYGMALVHAAKSSREQAAEALERFSSTATILGARTDATVRGRILLPQALMELGDLALQKESGGSDAARLYGEAVAALEKLNAAIPGNAEVRRNLGIAYGSQGDAFSETKSWREAVECYGRYAATMRTLTQQDPTNMDWRRELSVALNNCGDTQVKLEDYDNAMLAFEEALILRRQLAAIDAKNEDAQFDLTGSLVRLGKLALYQKKNSNRALKEFIESQEIAEANIANAGKKERWHYRRLSSLQLRAAALAQRGGTGDKAAAFKMLDTVLEEVKKLEAAPGHQTDPEHSLAQFEKHDALIRRARQAATNSSKPAAPKSGLPADAPQPPTK